MIITIIITIIIIVPLPWYFIPRVLRLANVKMYVRNGYDGDSETVNIGKAHLLVVTVVAVAVVVVPHSSWSPLNRFRTGQGLCLANLHKWHLATSDLCTCHQ